MEVLTEGSDTVFQDNNIDYCSSLLHRRPICCCMSKCPFDARNKKRALHADSLVSTKDDFVLRLWNFLILWLINNFSICHLGHWGYCMRKVIILEVGRQSICTHSRMSYYPRVGVPSLLLSHFVLCSKPPAFLSFYSAVPLILKRIETSTGLSSCWLLFPDDLQQWLFGNSWAMSSLDKATVGLKPPIAEA